MGMRTVTDAELVKLLTALGYCVGESSIFTVFQQYVNNSLGIACLCFKIRIPSLVKQETLFY